MVRIFLLERGDKPVKGGGVDVEMGGVATFLLLYSYFFDLQYFELAIQDSHPCFYCTKTWHHLYISDPLW